MNETTKVTLSNDSLLSSLVLLEDVRASMALKPETTTFLFTYPVIGNFNGINLL